MITLRLWSRGLDKPKSLKIKCSFLGLLVSVKTLKLAWGWFGWLFYYSGIVYLWQLLIIILKWFNDLYWRMTQCVRSVWRFIFISSRISIHILFYRYSLICCCSKPHHLSQSFVVALSFWDFCLVWIRKMYQVGNNWMIILNQFLFVM